MRQILCLLALVMLLSTSMVSAQNCTIDSSFNGFGFSPPDSLLPCLEQGLPYDTSITINLPATLDLADFGAPFPATIDLDSVVITDILNLPTGISYTCEPPSCKWNGGEKGCINFSGTTNDPIGPYELDVVSCITVSNLPQIPGFPIPSDTTICGAGSQAPGGIGFGLTLQVTSQGGPCPCLFPDLDFDFVTSTTTADLTPTASNADTTWWEFGDGSDADGSVTSHDYDLTNQFAFSVTLFGENACGKDSVTKTVLFTTGIQPLDQNANLISVFPNPNTGQFTLKIENYINVQEDVAVSLVNLQGKEVYTNVVSLNGNIIQQEISLDDLSNGVYFLTVRSENFAAVKKVMIQ